MNCNQLLQVNFKSQKTTEQGLEKSGKKLFTIYNSMSWNLQSIKIIYLNILFSRATEDQSLYM